MKWRISAEITFRVDAIVEAKDLSGAQNKFLYGSVDKIKDQFTDVFVHAKYVRTCDPVEIDFDRTYAVNELCWKPTKVGSVELPTVKNSSGLGESCTPFCDDDILDCVRCQNGAMNREPSGALVCCSCGYVEPGQRGPEDEVCPEHGETCKPCCHRPASQGGCR